MKKQAIRSFNFIKAICALGIIAYHFSCHLRFRDFLPLHLFANGKWGDAFVTIFFMVSGALLYYNYSEKISYPVYFKKRWLSLFPMFYLAYISLEMGRIFDHKAVLFRGELSPYIYSLLGMDGYLKGATVTYYNVGEWFLGAIIILYILFPVIRYFFRKNDKIVFALVLALYIIFLDKPMLNEKAFWSITSCLISFVSGMMIINYKSYIFNKWATLVSGVGFLIVNYVRLPFSMDAGTHLMGVFLFVFMLNVGEWVMKIRFFESVFNELSKMSYAIFLLQHVIILKILKVWNPAAPVNIMILLICTTLLILWEAKILCLVNDYVVAQVGVLISKVKAGFKKLTGGTDEKHVD